MPESLVDEPSEREVLRRVDRPTPLRKILRVANSVQSETIGVAQNVLSDMFTPCGIIIFTPCPLKRRYPEPLDVEPTGIRPLRDNVTGVLAVRLPFDEFTDHAVDNLRFDEGAVRGHTDHNIRVLQPSRLIVSIEDVILAASEAPPPAGSTQFCGHIIDRTSRRRNEQVVEHLRAAETSDAPREHRLACQLREDFPRQPAAPHACLNDRNRSHRKGSLTSRHQVST